MVRIKTRTYTRGLFRVVEKTPIGVMKDEDRKDLRRYDIERKKHHIWHPVLTGLTKSEVEVHFKMEIKD